MTSDPYLSRTTGDGIRIDIHWNEPEVVKLACVRLATDYHPEKLIDTQSVPVSDALDALNHPAMYSDLYAELVK